MKLSIFLLIIFCFFSVTPAFAESDYVLPYPSFMPGSKFYKLEQIKDNLWQYWSFGNYGQFVYHLNLSDKYLVEAKTLFEYKQYLLAYMALQKSNKHFEKLPNFLENAQKEQKDISQKQKILSDAARKHIEVIDKLKKELPESFTWQPENSSETALDLKQLLEASAKIRTKAL